MAGNRYQIDMCHGPLFSKIVFFSLPLFFTNVLQLLFNAADLVVLGHYAPHESMAAVGATINLNNLVVNSFIGLSVGTNVLAARFFGGKDLEGVMRTIRTSITVAPIMGLALMFIGLLIAKPVLILMGTPASVLPKACVYLRICFCAIPFIMLYNFGCSILRALGDTRKPFYILVVAGTGNLLLNLFFVIICGMDVGGVALATTISHAISACLVLRTLCFSGHDIRLKFKELSIDTHILIEMLEIGIPAGVQGACFSLSNMVLQSSINSFGSLAMAGSTATQAVEGIPWSGAAVFHQAAISFVAQNLGGRRFGRIFRSLIYCFLCGSITCLIIGWGFYLIGTSVLALINPDVDVIAWGMIRMKIFFTTYLIASVMEVASGGLRGIGYSMYSAVVSFLGCCVFRIFWVYFIFPLHRTMEFLLLCLPISWALSAIFSTVLLFVLYGKIVHRHCVSRSIEWSKFGPGVLKGFRFGGLK